jgi:hypothetical protein
MIFQYQNNNLLAQRQHKHRNDKKSDIAKLLNTYTSVDTEMCCAKGKCILNRKSEFIIYQFIINDIILYPLGGGGGYDENVK